MKLQQFKRTQVSSPLLLICCWQHVSLSLGLVLQSVCSPPWQVCHDSGISEFTLTASCSISGYLCGDSDSAFCCLPSVVLSHSGGRTYDPAISCLSCFPIQYQVDNVAKSFQFRIEPGLLRPHLQQPLYADTGENLPGQLLTSCGDPTRPSLFTGFDICCVGFCPQGTFPVLLGQRKGCSGMELISLRIIVFFSPWFGYSLKLSNDPFLSKLHIFKIRSVLLADLFYGRPA